MPDIIGEFGFVRSINLFALCPIILGATNDLGFQPWRSASQIKAKYRRKFLIDPNIADFIYLLIYKLSGFTLFLISVNLFVSNIAISAIVETRCCPSINFSIRAGIACTSTGYIYFY